MQTFVIFLFSLISSSLTETGIRKIVVHNLYGDYADKANGKNIFMIGDEKMTEALVLSKKILIQ